MKSIKTKLLASVIALALAVTLATTTTYAWFSMNSKVDVTGLEMNVTTQGDLLISNTATPTNWDSSITFDAFTNKYLNPVTIATNTNGALTFKSITLVQDSVKDHYYKMDIYFKSVSQYDIYFDTFNITAEPRTYTDPVSGLVTIDKAVAAPDYYFSKGTTLYKVTDIVVEGTVFKTVKINGAEKAITENAGDPKTYTLVEDGVTLTFSFTAENQISIAFSGDDMHINKGAKITADAINALRIGISDNATTDPKVTVVDPKPTEGWSKYTNIKMAHDYYNSVSTTPLEEALTKETVVTPVPGFTAKLLTLQPSGDVVDGDVQVYTGHLTLYMWLEGSDADCLASIANSIFKGNMSFRGVYIQE